MSRLKILSRWGLKKTRGSAFIREDVQHKLIDYINALVPAILLLALAIVIYEFGFKPFWSNHVGINFWLRTILTAAVVLTGTRQFLEIFTPKRKGARIVGFFWIPVCDVSHILCVTSKGSYLLYGNQPVPVSKAATVWRHSTGLYY
jgi:uncharacterized membrane protein YadS